MPGLVSMVDALTVSRSRGRSAVYSGRWAGLVGLWQPSLGPTGLTLFDHSGYGNHGTLTSMDPATDWKMTEKGWALDLDGVDDYIRFPRPPQITSTGPATISLWAKLTEAPALLNLFNLSDGTNNIMLAYWWNNGNGMIVRNGTNSRNTQSFSSNPDITLWHHYAFVRTGNNNLHQLYVDGVNLTANNGAELADEDVDTFDISQGFDGAYESAMQIAGVALFDCCLSVSEIQLLYRDEHALTRLADRRVVATTGGAPPAGTPWLYARLGSRVIGAA